MLAAAADMIRVAATLVYAAKAAYAEDAGDVTAIR